MIDVHAMTRISKSTLVFALFVGVAALCIYLPGLNHALIFDDARLTDGTIFGIYGNLLEVRPRMLSYGSFVWLQPLFDESYAGQRVINLLLHLCACGAIWLLMKELFAAMEIPAGQAATVAQDDLEASRRAALVVAVGLFAVHPVATYAVGYLIQRSIVMATLFSALSCFAMARGLRLKKLVWVAAAFVAYALALMSKEHSIMVAGIWVAIYIFIRRPKWQHTVIVSGVALALLAAAAFLLMQRYGSIIGAHTFDETSKGYIKQLEGLQPGIQARIYPLSVLNEAALFFYYGFLWAIPNVQWMSIDIRTPFPLSFTEFPQVLGASAFIILAAGSFWLLLRRKDHWSLAALCTLSAILLYATELVTSWLQDPFVLYRSYLWAFMAPGVVAAALIGLKARTIYVFGAIAVIALSALSWERMQTFRDDLTLWSDAAEKIDLNAPQNAVGRWRPFLNRGAYFLERGQDQNALQDFGTAVKLGEPMGSAYFNAGMSLQMLKQYPQALAAFSHAESLGFTEAALYYQRAESFKATGRLKEAFDSYSLALKKPQADEARKMTLLQRAEIALPTRQYDAAIADFTALLKSEPDSERYLIGLGIANVGAQKIPRAMKIFDRVLADKPVAAAHYGRALAHSALKDLPAAMRELDRAIALEPANRGYRSMKQQLARQAAGHAQP